MCLATVYVDKGDGQMEEVMRDVALVELESRGFLLTTLLGTEKLFPTKIKSIDLLNGSIVVEGDSTNIP
jgi:predicted RNA-binding protein